MLTSVIFFMSMQAVEIITVDTLHWTAISPYIYGANYPDWDKMNVPFTLARQGGNRMTAYNWETNASNAGNDFHFQNDGYMGESNEPGWTVRTFLQPAQVHGAAALLTVPTAGYVSSDKNGDGDVAKTPDYIHTRFYKSVSTKNASLVYPPDTTDKMVYQDEFVHWVESIKSSRTPVWFSLDNEPDLWGSTHVRLWPKGATYAQIIANNIDFAGAIKKVAPKTLVFGPANYGWNGFRTFQGAPDGAGRDFLDVYLAAMKDAESKAGKRLLDVLDIHWYPEARGDDVRITDESDKPGLLEARIQAPRSLWDPTYTEDSWIAKNRNGKPIELIPGIQGQIAKQYPGTKFAITEYNYGGGQRISGALAQADALGIFGRYGLFAASNWGIGPKDTSEMAAFRAYLDFDGKGARFGDRGLKVTGASAAQNSVYASLDSKMVHRLTIVAINKTAAPMPFSIGVGGFKAGSIRAFAIDETSPAEAHSIAASFDSGKAQFSAPAHSVVSLELK
jgi:hypothetical protein